MCDTCGCNLTPGNQRLMQADGQHINVGGAATTEVKVLQRLLSENDLQAAHNREHLEQHRVFTVNLMSSPGAGKTALLEASIDALQDQFNIAVIEGDIETENDAKRIRAKGVPAIQIVTGGACHLDAHMVHDALHHLPLANIDILFIENVGNLICPASFDLGHHRNVALLSVTEGDDKPAKYPVMFRAADLMLITKSDLLPVLDDFDTNKAQRHLRQLANSAPVYTVSAKTSEGTERWLHWLQHKVKTYLEALDKGVRIRPYIQNDGVKLHAKEHSILT
jgi:hydrogenase nickel incorporation protein HypB